MTRASASGRSGSGMSSHPSAGAEVPSATATRMRRLTTCTSCIKNVSCTKLETLQKTTLSEIRPLSATITRPPLHRSLETEHQPPRGTARKSTRISVCIHPTRQRGARNQVTVKKPFSLSLSLSLTSFPPSVRLFTSLSVCAPSLPPLSSSLPLRSPCSCVRPPRPPSSASVACKAAWLAGAFAAAAIV